MRPNRFLELGDPHNELPSLTNHESFTLEPRQMLGHPGPRGSDQVGDVLLAESYSEQRAARFRDSKIGTQFEQRYRDSLMKSEIQKTAAAQQQPIPLLQIVFVEMPERRFGGFRCDAIEILEAKGAHSAIVVSFALEMGPAHRQRRKLWNQTGREQHDRHPLAVGVYASDPRSACQQNMCLGGEVGFVQDHGASFVVGDRESADQQGELCGGKPGNSFKAAQVVEVGITMTFEFIQYCTIRMMF